MAMALEGTEEPLAPRAAAPESLRQGAHGPKLNAVRKQIENDLSPEEKDGYDRVMLAAETLLFSPKTHHVLIETLENIQESDKPAEALAEETISVLHVVYSESKQKAKIESILAAAIPVMTMILEFGIASHGLDGSQEMISESAQILMSRLMQEAGVPVEGEAGQGPEEPAQRGGLIAGAAPQQPPLAGGAGVQAPGQGV